MGRDSASWAFAALAARLGDDSAAVREAAVKGLATISEKGNRNLVLAMANLIEEETAITVRTAALQALTRVAHRGDNEALEPVLNLLRRVEGTERGEYFNPNLSTGIKAQAVKALSTLASHDNDSAIKIMSGRILDDPNPQVREAAIKGMASLAMNYDRSPHVPQMTWALAIACHDGDERVRTAALKHLRLLQKSQAGACRCGRAGPVASTCTGGPPAADGDRWARWGGGNARRRRRRADVLAVA